MRTTNLKELMRSRRVVALIVLMVIGGYFLYYMRFPNLLHGPITIESNTDFVRQGFPGSGSIDDPYVISMRTIYSDTYCIKISNTTAHFVIKNCRLETGPDSTASVWFDSTVNGVIQNCEILSVETGIRLDSARDYIVADNDIYGVGVAFPTYHFPVYRSRVHSDQFGISAYYGSGGVYSGNVIHDLGGGMWFDEVHSMIWSSNTVERFGYLFFIDLNHLFVTGCQFTDGDVDLYNVTDSVFINCDHFGADIRAEDSSDVRVRHSNFINGGIVGSSLAENCSVTNPGGIGIKSGGTITNCTVFGCNDGIVTNSATITNCIVRDNSLSGITFQWAYNGGLVQDVDIFGNGLSGIFIDVQGDDIDVIDCNIWDNSEHGVYVFGWEEPDIDANHYRISVTSCDIYQNNKTGVYLMLVEGGTVDNNYIHDNGEWGLYLEKCVNMGSYAGNTFANNGIGDVVDYSP